MLQAPVAEQQRNVEVTQFILPSALDEKLAAIIAIRAYVRQHNYSKSLYLGNLPPCIEFLLEWLRDENTSTVGGTASDPDFEFVFDPEVAHNFAKVTELHAVDAYSSLLGSKPMTSYAVDPTFPPIDMLQSVFKERDSVDIVVLSSQFYDAVQVADLIADTSATVAAIAVDPSNLDHEVFSFVRSSKTVVGDRSIYTYLASAMNKRVVEMYPDNVHRNWLSKWDSPNYRMVLLRGVSHVKPQAVWRVLEHNKWVTMEG